MDEPGPVDAHADQQDGELAIDVCGLAVVEELAHRYISSISAA
jgi:hypothetical protein